MKPVRTAIIGAGHLGKIHTKLAHAAPEIELVAVVDPILSSAEQLAREYGIQAYAQHDQIANNIEAAIIATPTFTHYDVALELLTRGVHVFIEKPITLNATDAAVLIAEAERRNLVLQVGHVERFNPAFIAANNVIANPRSFHCVRKGTYTGRSTDVSVVLDLMIHDLDLVLSLAQAPPVHVTGSGEVVIGPNEDWAEARITFANGSSASFAASRVHTHAERKMEIIGLNGSVALDFQTKQATMLEFAGTCGADSAQRCETSASRATPSKPASERLIKRELPIQENNAILEEQREFATAIRGTGAVTVSGEAGHAALALAEQILAEIAANRHMAAQSQRRQALQREFQYWQSLVRKAA